MLNGQQEPSAVAGSFILFLPPITSSSPERVAVTRNQKDTCLDPLTFKSLGLGLSSANPETPFSHLAHRTGSHKVKRGE